MAHGNVLMRSGVLRFCVASKRELRRALMFGAEAQYNHGLYVLLLLVFLILYFLSTPKNTPKKSALLIFYLKSMPLIYLKFINARFTHHYWPVSSRILNAVQLKISLAKLCGDIFIIDRFRHFIHGMIVSSLNHTSLVI